MLTAYFDDSGTHTGGKHGPSRIVLVAGVLGTEDQLIGLEQNWQRHLDAPLCGRKNRLSQFHAFDCNDSRNEFAGWSRTETDFFMHHLQDIIIESGVGIYGVAIAREDWDELVTGDMRRFLGDAERYCISQCFVRGINWANRNTFEPKMTFIFASRTPEVQRLGLAVGHAFQQHSTWPEIVGTSFLKASAIRPLQAADLVAWELYQHAREILSGRELDQPKRPALKRFHKETQWMVTQIAQRDEIHQIINLVKRDNSPADIKALADHFTSFDPSAFGGLSS
jgi:hypothetical protein